MDVRLVLDKPPTRQQAWHLHREETVVGRRRDCHLRILSAEVSRRHCLLSTGRGYVQVEDLGSSNGTFVNGRPVVDKEVVLPGDHLQIGPVEFIVEYELSPSAQDRLSQQLEGKAAEVELEVLPVAEKVVKGNAEPLEPSSSGKSEPLPPPIGSEVESPFAFVNEEMVEDWRLPQTNDLRDLLSQVESQDPAAGARVERNASHPAPPLP